MSKSVLIVDRNIGSRNEICRVISTFPDCRAVAFADTLSAVDWLSTGEPAMIFLDDVTVGISSREILRLVRFNRQLAGVTVVLISDRATAELVDDAVAEGARGVLQRPVIGVDVRRWVKAALAARPARQRLVDSVTRRSIARASSELRARELELIMRLCRAAEFRDPDTGTHIERMALYSRLIAAELGLGAALVDDIHAAAPMHDIGKLGIPDRILLKPGALTETERTIMNRHSQIGHDLLADSEVPLFRLGAEIALNHHERFDGTGYPSGKVGRSIPISGRIVAVADVFDALTSVRPYKAAWGLERAREYINRGRGGAFDPDCVDVFFSHWDEVIAIHDRVSDGRPSTSPSVPLDIAKVKDLFDRECFAGGGEEGVTYHS